MASPDDYRDGVEAALAEVEAETGVDASDEALGGNAPRKPRGKASTTTATRGSALLLVGRLLGMALGLVIQLLLVRVLTREDYGSFAWALSVVTLVTALIPLGLDRIDSRFLAKYDERGDDRRVVGVLLTELLVVLVLGSVAFVVVYLLHGRLAPSIAPSTTAEDLLVVMVLLAPLTAIDQMVMNTFATFAKARAVFFRRYLLEPGLRLTAILAVYLAGAGVFGLMVGYLLASVVGVGIYVVMVVRLLGRIGVLDELHGKVVLPFREMMREGLPLLSGTLVYVVITAMPTLVLGAVGGSSDVAALRATQPIASLSLAASGAFWVLYPPLLARQWERRDWVNVRLSYWRTALWVAVTSYPALVLGVAFAAPTVRTLLGEQYADSAPLLVVTAAAYWFQTATGFSAVLLATAGRLRFLLLTNIGTLVGGGLVAFWLIPAHGAWGAALTMAVTLGLSNAVRQFGLRGLPTRVVDRRILLPFAAMVVGVLLCVGIQAEVGLNFVAAVIVGGIVSLAVLVVTLPYLDVRATFPELRRVPGMERLLTVSAAWGPRTTSNPYLLPTPPSLQPRTDDDVQAPPPPPPPPAPATSEAHDDGGEVALALLVPGGAPATLLGPLPLDRLEAALAEVPAGTWVVARLTARPRTFGSTRRRLADLGLDDAVLHWEAPDRERRAFLVPAEHRGAVLAALDRTRTGVRLVAGHWLVRSGLTSFVTRDLVVVGRRRTP